MEYSMQEQLIAKVVKDADTYTENIINTYIQEQERKGIIVQANLIPEGKLRHIINLGVSVLNKDINPDFLFPQEEYIEYLRDQIINLQKENQKLKNQIHIMEEVSGLRSVDTKLGGEENEKL